MAKVQMDMGSASLFLFIFGLIMLFGGPETWIGVLCLVISIAGFIMDFTYRK